MELFAAISWPQYVSITNSSYCYYKLFTFLSIKDLIYVKCLLVYQICIISYNLHDSVKTCAEGMGDWIFCFCFDTTRLSTLRDIEGHAAEWTLRINPGLHWIFTVSPAVTACCRHHWSRISLEYLERTSAVMLWKYNYYYAYCVFKNYIFPDIFFFFIYSGVMLAPSGICVKLTNFVLPLI